jgi:hypothetical protein
MADEEEVGATPGFVRGFEDKVLDTMEGHIDFAEGYQRKLFDGEQLDEQAVAARMRELKALGKAISLRVADIGVRVVGAYPELQGRGARFVAVDLQNRQYKVDLHLDDEQRMAGETFDAMLDGIDSVNISEKAIRQALSDYLEAERLERLGLVLGKKAS